MSNPNCFLVAHLLILLHLACKGHSNTAAFAFSLHSILQIDLYKDDVLLNFVTMDSQLMNGAIPWKELREKDLLFLKMLIEASIEVDDIVIDNIVATSDSLPLNFMIFYSRLFTIQFLLHNCHVILILQGLPFMLAIR